MTRPVSAAYGRDVLPVLRVLLLVVFQVAASFGAAQRQTGHRAIDALGVLLLVVGPLSLLALRRAPWVALAVPLAAAITWFASGYPGGPIPIAFVVAVVVCTVRGRRAEARVAVSLGVVAVTLGWLLGDEPLGAALGATAWLLVLLTVAEQVRSHRDALAERRRSRVEEARRRASEERLRIARELHDVLAHSISLISVQAGVALHLMDSQPTQVRTSLETIRDASRNTLAELRATVGALRSAEDEAPLRPLPGLESLEALTGGVAAAGLQVRTTVTGDRRPVPAGVDLAAYRIVQEALTNVARHAGTSTAEVHIDFGPTVLGLRIVDSGSGHGPVTAGNGLTGMRERATALGGRLVAGPRPEGGFCVEAELPVTP